MASLFEAFYKPKTMTSFSQNVGTQSKGVSAIAGMLLNTVSSKSLIVVDATMSIDEDYQTVTTEHPVESGKEVTDNAVLKPMELTIRGVVVDEPLDLTNAMLNNVVSGASSLIPNSIGRAVATGVMSKVGGYLLNGAGGSRSEAAKNALKDARKNKTLIQITCKAGVFDNMLITRLSFPNTVETGRDVEFVCSLREVNIVESRTVLVSALRAGSAVAKSATPKANLGTKSADVLGDSKSVAVNNSSVLPNASYSPVRR